MESNTVVLNKSFEARSLVRDLNLLKAKVKKAGGKLKSKSVFIDHIFQPRGGKWNLDEKNLKLRFWKKGENAGLVEIKYYPAKWKKGIKEEIAALNSILFDEEEALNIIKDWNFEELFSFSRQREIYEVKDLLIFLEKIDYLGGMVEVEGDREIEVEKTFVELGLGKRIAHSVPYLVWKHLKTKK